MFQSTKVLVCLFFVTLASWGNGQMKYPCVAAFRKCEFRFNNVIGLPTFYIGKKADRPFTSRVIYKNKKKHVGILNTNITPQFVFMNRAVNITKFGNPRLTPYHFKPFYKNNTKGSSIGHQTFQGNQMSVASSKCVRIYFSAFQVLDSKNGNVIDNMNDVPKYKNKCVVFRTTKDPMKATMY